MKKKEVINMEINTVINMGLDITVTVDGGFGHNDYPLTEEDVKYIQSPQGIKQIKENIIRRIKKFGLTNINYSEMKHRYPPSAHFTINVEEKSREDAITEWNKRKFPQVILSDGETISKEELDMLRLRYKSGKLLKVPDHCETCAQSKPYGMVGERYCKILEDYFKGNVKPPYKERADECPLSDLQYIPALLKKLNEVEDKKHGDD